MTMRTAIVKVSDAHETEPLLSDLGMFLLLDLSATVGSTCRFKTAETTALEALART